MTRWEHTPGKARQECLICGKQADDKSQPSNDVSNEIIGLHVDFSLHKCCGLGQCFCPRAARTGRQDAGALRYLAGRLGLSPLLRQAQEAASGESGRDRGRTGLSSSHRAPSCLREGKLCRPLRRGYGRNHPKTDIRVEVVRFVPVTDGAAGVPLIIVPGTATHHARLRPGPENAASRLRGLRW